MKRVFEREDVVGERRKIKGCGVLKVRNREIEVVIVFLEDRGGLEC